jgi:hypothetical protein
MVMHTFKCCINAEHLFFQVTDSIPHIGSSCTLLCPLCEREVSVTYLGQNINPEYNFNDIPTKDNIILYTDPETGNTYCLRCNGSCTQL